MYGSEPHSIICDLRQKMKINVAVNVIGFHAKWKM
jgi:hypothetical protein